MAKKKVKTMLEFESLLNHYLTNDIPLALMDDFYELNLRQRGFMLNRVYDYSAKEDMLTSLVNDEESIGVSSQYLLLNHDIMEEKPVSPEEQVTFFREKEAIENKLQIIEKEVTIDDLPYIKEVNQKLSKIPSDKLELAIKIHDLIEDKIDLDDELNEKRNIVDEEEIRERVKKDFNLNDYKLDYLLELYAEYNSLLMKKKEFVQNIARNNIHEYSELKIRYDELMDTIIKKNVKLANWVVRKYFKYIPAEMEEMQAYALEGLAVAVKAYDYKLGYRFSTLATIIIRHRIQRYFKTLTGLTWDNYLRVVRYNQAVNTYQEVMGTDEVPTIDDLYDSNLFGLSYEELVVGNAYAKFVTLPFSNVLPMDPLDLRDKRNASLKTMEDYKEEDEYEDFSANKLGLIEDGEDYLDQAELSALKNNIQEVLGTLTEREAKVLRLRFGLDGDEPKTLEQVASVFNVTRERIRQIEAKALRKLRHPSRSRKLDIYREVKTHRFQEKSKYPLWVDALENNSEAKILSMMLRDYIEDKDFNQDELWVLARRYGLWADEEAYEKYDDEFFDVVEVLEEINEYDNLFVVKKDVEEVTKINLPVNFYHDYLHEVAKIKPTRKSL